MEELSHLPYKRPHIEGPRVDFGLGEEKREEAERREEKQFGFLFGSLYLGREGKSAKSQF